MTRPSVLYVDDDRSNLLAMEYALSDAIDLRIVESGDEALRFAEGVDVLVADQRMPGMSGVEVCRRFRELNPRAARILYTAYADMQAGIAAINEGGVSQVLVKPVLNEDLLAAIFESYESRRDVCELEVLAATSARRGTRAIELALGRAMSGLMPMLFDEGAGSDRALRAAVVSLQAGTTMQPIVLHDLARTGIPVSGEACGLFAPASLVHALALLEPESIELREEAGLAHIVLRSISVARDTRRVASAVLERGGAHVVARDGDLILTTRSWPDAPPLEPCRLRPPSLDVLIVGEHGRYRGSFENLSVAWTDPEGALRRAWDARVVVVDERSHDAAICGKLRDRGAHTIILRVAQPDFVRHRPLAPVIDRLVHDGQTRDERRKILFDCVHDQHLADEARATLLDEIRAEVTAAMAHGRALWGQLEKQARPLLVREGLREAWRACEHRAWPST